MNKVVDELLKISKEIYNSKLLASLYIGIIDSIDDIDTLFKIRHVLSTQEFCKYPEKLITKKLLGKQLKTSLKCGDFNCEKYENVEYKYCVIDHDTKHFGHWLQIRHAHDIQHYIFQTFLEDTKSTKTYLLSKQQILLEIEKGSTNTHNKNKDEKTITLDKNRMLFWDSNYLTSI